MSSVINSSRDTVGLVWKIYDPEDSKSAVHLVGNDGEFYNEELLNISSVKRIFNQTKTIILAPGKMSRKIVMQILEAGQNQIAIESRKYPEKIFTKLNDIIALQFRPKELSPSANLMYEAYCDSKIKKSPMLDFFYFSLIFLLSNFEKAKPMQGESSWQEVLEEKEVRNLFSEVELQEHYNEYIRSVVQFFSTPEGILILKSLWRPEFLQKFLQCNSLLQEGWRNGDLATFTRNAMQFFKFSIASDPFFTQKEVEHLEEKLIKTQEINLELVLANAERNQIVLTKEDLTRINFIKEVQKKQIKVHETFLSSIELIESNLLKAQIDDLELFFKLSKVRSKNETDRQDTEKQINRNIYKLQKSFEARYLSAKQEKMENADQPFLQEYITRLVTEKQLALVVTKATKERISSLQTYFQKKGWQMEQVTIPMKTVGFCWEVVCKQSGRKGTLLGTIHRASHRVLDLNSQILKRFEQASAVAVEIDITRPDMLKKIKKYILENDTKIKCFSELEKEVQLAKLDKLRSFFSQNSLEQPKKSKNTAKQYLSYLMAINRYLYKQIEKNKGIETTLIPKAIEKGKPVINLEILEDHLKSFSLETFGNHLEYFNHEAKIQGQLVSNNDFTLEKMVKDFKKTQISNVAEALEDAMKWGYSEMISILNLMKKDDLAALNFRNIKIVMKISELITNHDFPFIMVGAAHFPGEMGLISLLEKSDYSCERIIVYEPIIA